MIRIPLLDPKPRKDEVERIFNVPKGFVPTRIKQKNRKLKVKFTKFKLGKLGIRQPSFIEKEIEKEFDIPKKLKLSRAFTIERGATPRKFRVFFKKDITIKKKLKEIV